MINESKLLSLESIGANLLLPPSDKDVDYTGRHLVHGDLHSNPLRLIWFLMLIGVMELGDKEYTLLAGFLVKHCPQYDIERSRTVSLGQLVTQQGKSKRVHKIKLNSQAIKKFEEARSLFRSTLGLNTPELKPKKRNVAIAHKGKCAHITDIGDTVGDRGPDDRFILDLNEWRHKNGVNFTIMLGNHDAFSFGVWHLLFSTPDKTPKSRKKYRQLLLSDHYMLDQLAYTHSPSLNNSLYSLFGQPNDEAFTKELKHLKFQVENYFMPHLSLMEAVMSSEGRVIVNTHTPAPESLFIAVGKIFGVTWNGETEVDIFQSVNNINAQFKRALKLSPQMIHEQLDDYSSPLHQFVCYRPEKQSSSFETLLGGGVHNFGHINRYSAKQSKKHFTAHNLDTELGMDSSATTEDLPLKIFSFFPKSPVAISGVQKQHTKEENVSSVGVSSKKMGLAPPS